MLRCLNNNKPNSSPDYGSYTLAYKQGKVGQDSHCVRHKVVIR